MEKLLKSIPYSFLILALLFSCSEDDEEEAATPAKLVGVWSYSSSDVDLTLDGKSLEQYYIDMGVSAEEAKTSAESMEALITEGSFGTGSTMEFKSDNTYSVNFADEDPESGTWDLSSDGKSLTVDDDMVLQVKSFTNSKMSLNMEESDDFDMDQDGVSEAMMKISVTFHFTK